MVDNNNNNKMFNIFAMCLPDFWWSCDIHASYVLTVVLRRDRGAEGGRCVERERPKAVCMCVLYGSRLVSISVHFLS